MSNNDDENPNDRLVNQAATTSTNSSSDTSNNRTSTPTIIINSNSPQLQSFLNNLDSEQFILYTNTLLNTIAAANTNTNTNSNLQSSMENFNRFGGGAGAALPLFDAQMNPNANQYQQAFYRYQQQLQQQRQHSHSHSHGGVPCTGGHSHSHNHQQFTNIQDLNGSNSQAAESQDVVLNLLPHVIHDVETNNDINTDADAEQHLLHDDSQHEAQNNNNIVKLALLALQTNIPILLILFAKIFHQHLLGFLIVLAFMATLHWSNRLLVNQVELKEKKNNVRLMILICFLLSNVALFFFAFSSYQLQYCLIFLETNIKHMDIWNLLWIVVCCDIIAKIMTICIKAIITLLPCRFIPIRKRGNYYSAVEAICLLYRCITPIHPWILFLMYTNNNGSDLLRNKTDAVQSTVDANIATSSWFPIILCILYIITKLNQLYNRYSDVMRIFADILLDQSYGTPVNKLNLEENAVCPICQDKYTNPVQLKCKHIFCHDCVAVWLDREQTCPMCRAKVTTKKPTHKDGSTSIYIQWY